MLERMRKLLKRKLKVATKSVPPYAFEHMMDSFINTVKPEFDGTDDHFIQLPASLELSSLTNEEIGLDEGVLCLTMQELRDEVFEPVVQDVLKLIHQQKSTVEKLEAIFLVGGFGSSNYLFKRVQQEFGNEVPLIGVPPRAGNAILYTNTSYEIMATLNTNVQQNWRSLVAPSTLAKIQT
ncbi:unnamed protein product [Umbelopsis sp. WA50703]